MCGPRAEDFQKPQWSGAWSWIPFRWVKEATFLGCLFPREPPTSSWWWPGVRHVRLQQRRWAWLFRGWPEGAGYTWEGEFLTLLSPGTSQGSRGRQLEGSPASWRRQSLGELPPTASPKTGVVATDRVAASASRGHIGMSYGGRNVTVGNPMPGPGLEECSVWVGVKVGAGGEQTVSRPLQPGCSGVPSSESTRKPALLLPTLPCPGLAPVAKSSLILGRGSGLQHAAVPSVQHPSFFLLLLETFLNRGPLSIPFRPTNGPFWE